MGNPKRCQICGGRAVNQHFGAIACNACAAFFRRSLATPHRYSCSRDESCRTLVGEGRYLCKFHRFRRCIQSGMMPSAVIPQTVGQNGVAPILGRIVLAQKSTFADRFVWIRSLGGDALLNRIGTPNPHFSHFIALIGAESNVLKKYLNSTGIFLNLTSEQTDSLLPSLLSAWLCYQSAMATLRNNGHRTQLLYLMDESHLDVNEETVAEFVSGIPGIIDRRLMQSAVLNFLLQLLESVARTHKSQLDEIQQAAVFHLFALRLTLRTFPQSRADCLFTHLRQYYDHIGEDTALRLGNVILATEQLETLSRDFTELITLLQLNGYDNPMPASVA